MQRERSGNTCKTIRRDKSTANGVYDSVVRSLNNAEIPFVELGGVKPNPRSGLVYEGIDLYRREGVDFILAVGGRSSIDSAKAIALGYLMMEVSGISMKQIVSSQKRFRLEPF